MNGRHEDYEVFPFVFLSGPHLLGETGLTIPSAGKIPATLVVALSLAALFTACGDSPSSPSTPSTGFIMAVQPTSDTVTFQATMGNQTFTASGVSTPRLSPGTHTLSGTFSPPGRTSGEGLIFIFVRDPDSAGGVRMGSLRSLAGPVAHVASCFAVYVTSATTTATQSFSLQFEVTADAADACPQPG